MKRKSNMRPASKKFNTENDTYGIFVQEIEVDTDVNEDPNRERLLDESLDAFLKIKKRVTY
ncbi:hypothetical protein [Halalkalibacter urbisdiaboli]|uniref:hypothetical protein n=1 Tax=Halalkalibacter urbisdiaboli TaxID=1960589 RepID=UPI000B4531F6|nr:hypothetical protein [Halalkalibacter urbisdiaboli]